jgi:hypothetical protein
MHAYYRDYQWKEGKPVGIGITPERESLCYRIVSDPYRKWLSIEMYRDGQFEALLYDSRLLDFRKLKPADQVGWRKETAGPQKSWIFNEDDRVVLLEKYSDEGCEIYSPYGFPHGALLCRYVFFKKEARVILFDSHSRPVMTRQYRVYERGEFRDLIREDWSPSGADSTVHMPLG